MLLTLEREGKFDASASMIPNAHKCAAMATTEYSYSVKIEGSADTLSPEGYLINNELVQTYFDERFGTKAPKWDAVSCELIAVTACKELASHLRDSGIEVTCVECQIIGSNGAKIRAKWPGRVNACV